MHIRNPRTGQADYTISPPNPAQITDLVNQFRLAQIDWLALGVEGRVEAMQAWKNALERYKEAIIDALTTDTGRRNETLLELDVVLKSIDRWCGIARQFFAPPSQRVSSIPFISIEQDLVPYAVVGVISPWNFPLLLSVIDTIPALLAGCAVVVKPSEVTPRFIRPLLQTIAEVPALAKVFTYLEGAGETGAALVESCDLICFTGSTATGKRVYKQASERFVPVFLELGGKDAALVFEGADLDRASSALLWGSVVNTGQSCLSIERIYVQDTIYEEFVKRLIDKTEEIKLAYPTVSDGHLGPVISDKQVDIINEHLVDAIAKGAILQTGEPGCVKLGGGHYCRPTVLTNVNHSMKVMTDETFGPVMPIMPFRDEDEAIALANGTIYGLSGAVFAGNTEEAIRIARRMQCGAVSINDAALTAIMHEGEKNSFKLSGIGGTRMGPSAIKRFMRQKAYLIKTAGIPSPWWFG
ncbi:MAG: aldehyde dehydrogenase family protein [Cytophagales bacterium]|nr:MAG: aldehyde dehydrogenase family protein [Cytophagales bacterium]